VLVGSSADNEIRNATDEVKITTTNLKNEQESVKSSLDV
jgi:hypothetical protein